MELASQLLSTEILDPRDHFARRTLNLEVRSDPLTGHTARVLHGVDLFPDPPEGLTVLADKTRSSCPFCPERIEEATPRFPPEVVPSGRILVGEAVLFPNLLPYGRFASVSVYSPRLHHLELKDITPVLLRNNLAAQRDFIAAARRSDPSCLWASINGNYLPPSGSSVFHPHLQGSVGPQPTTRQGLLARVSEEQWRDYLDTERRPGDRYFGSTGRFQWFAAFAPLGSGEVRAAAPGVADIHDLDDELLEELAVGVAKVLGLYSELGQASFNLAIYGCPGSWLSVGLLHRSPPRAHYRSDVTWLERMHLEAAVSLTPEDLAAVAQVHFG